MIGSDVSAIAAPDASKPLRISAGKRTRGEFIFCIIILTTIFIRSSLAAGAIHARSVYVMAARRNSHKRDAARA
jgi:hypothetical protein